MSFYQTLVTYYDEIFPLNVVTQQFLCSIFPKNSCLLDMGAGTGTMSLALQKSGRKMTAFEPDSSMVEKIKQKNTAETEHILVYQKGMLELDEISESFDGIYCIGNTLAHLQNEQEIFRFFQQVYQHLHPTGILILQTVNFDQINKLKTFEFPVIRKENCIFMRKYEQNGTYIRFVITLKTQNEIRSNTTILFPASSQTILQLLQEAGFSHLQTYGNFKKEAFEKTSSAFIVIGQKV